MAELAWGRRFLMCPPQHFGVLYEINPWMHREVAVDHDAASAQWEELVATLRLAGAEVLTMDPNPSVPDLVFTANAGIVNGAQFVPSHFRHPERQAETEIDAAWFASHGYRVDRLPPDLDHEGAGDALPFTPAGGQTVLVSAYAFRSDAAAGPELGALLGCAVRAVQLVDPRLYHLDLTFCPLDDRRAMGAPGGWDAYGRKVIEALVPEPLWLEDHEALTFCANSVVVGTTIVMPSVPVARRPPARGVGLRRGAPPGRRVPQGGWRLPLPHPRARRHAALRGLSRGAHGAVTGGGQLAQGQDRQQGRHDPEGEVDDHEGGAVVAERDRRGPDRPHRHRPDRQQPHERCQPAGAPQQRPRRRRSEGRERQRQRAAPHLLGGVEAVVAPDVGDAGGPHQRGPRHERPGGGEAAGRHGPERTHRLP